MGRPKKKGTITQEELFKYVTYREDGHLVWKKRDPANRFVKTFNTLYAGKPLGNKTVNGYLETCIDQKRFLVHRLVFLYHHGYFPKFIDHIDGDPLNNRISNLREASHSENMHNTALRINNHSGSSVKGVYQHGDKGAWRVQIMANKVMYSKAGFSSMLAAEEYAKGLREKLHKDFARHK